VSCTERARFRIALSRGYGLACSPCVISDLHWPPIYLTPTAWLVAPPPSLGVQVKQAVRALAVGASTATILVFALLKAVVERLGRVLGCAVLLAARSINIDLRLPLYGGYTPWSSSHGLLPAINAKLTILPYPGGSGDPGPCLLSTHFIPSLRQPSAFSYSRCSSGDSCTTAGYQFAPLSLASTPN
jgi:hypothetical protein